MRLFTALELETPLLNSIRALQDELAGRFPLLRLSAPQSLHLTLNFMGEVAEHRLPTLIGAVETAIEGLSPFCLQTGQTGCFPPEGDVSIVWLSMGSSSNEVLKLQSRCAEALKECGFVLEVRPFTPHITLARVKQGLRISELRTHISALTPAVHEQLFTSLNLIQSVPGVGGSKYIPLRKFVLMQ